jgi:hypothetical protein
MAHGNLKVLDSDIHIIEPPDLWQRYIDPAFRDRAPLGLTEDAGDLRLAWEGKPWGRVAADADRSRRRHGHDHAKNQERWRPFQERGWTSKVQVEAMDTEGKGDRSGPLKPFSRRAREGVGRARSPLPRRFRASPAR